MISIIHEEHDNEPNIANYIAFWHHLDSEGNILKYESIRMDTNGN